jgi:AbrB family looped-hinge helix DNA binding protein
MDETTRKMKVFKNGRVTIPKELRDRAGIMPGSEVEFILHEDYAVIVPANNSIGEPDEDYLS